MSRFSGPYPIENIEVPAHCADLGNLSIIDSKGNSSGDPDFLTHSFLRERLRLALRNYVAAEPAAGEKSVSLRSAQRLNPESKVTNKYECV
jgi:hypothetical protein